MLLNYHIMQELITKNYNGFNIEFELIDGHLMANATAMCAAFGKRPADWTKTAATKRFIEAKGRKIVLAANQMVTSRYGGDENGTWIHECLILKLAAWLNVDFEIQCDEWVGELLRTGKVELAPKAVPSIQAHAERAVQIQNVKDVRSAQWWLGGKPATKSYFYESCLLVTGKTPAELKDWAKRNHWPSRQRSSGREVIRKARPEVACRMSVIDDLANRGVEVKEAAAISEGTTAYFKAMLALGYTPPELQG